MKTSKQDRQGVRTPADIERKYDLALLGKGSGGGGGTDADFSALRAELTQFQTYTKNALAKITSGWNPNVYLGSNDDGELSEMPTPLTDADMDTIVTAVLEALPNGDEVSY